MAATLSIRIDMPSGQRFGPGKAALLTALEKHGSIAQAARSLDMSYPRALKLVTDMNAQFKSPLVEKFHGGVRRGGANLTALGRQVLSVYCDLCDDAGKSTQAQRRRLAALIK